jgi:hypothetical protein
MVVDLIRSRVMLEAEIWTLRQQINVLRRTAQQRTDSLTASRHSFRFEFRHARIPPDQRHAGSFQMTMICWPSTRECEGDHNRHWESRAIVIGIQYLTAWPFGHSLSA